MLVTIHCHNGKEVTIVKGRIDNSIYFAGGIDICPVCKTERHLKGTRDIDKKIHLDNHVYIPVFYQIPMPSIL